MSGTDASLRTQVANERDRLLRLRVSTFQTNAPYSGDTYPPLGPMRVAANFLNLSPEWYDELSRLGLLASFQGTVRAAVDEYSQVAPYWFVAHYDATCAEGVMQGLYDAPALFQAKAYLLRESQAKLTRFLDVPAFQRGDLFYLQNLTAAIRAPE